MRLAWCQNEVDKAPSGIAHTNDLTPQTAPRTAKGLGIAAGVAIDSQTHIVGLLGVGLLGRAPAAF